MSGTDFAIEDSKEVRLVKIIASMIMPGLGQILSRKYAIGVGFLVAAILCGLLPSGIFALLPTLNAYLIQAIDPKGENFTLSTLVPLLVYAVFLFPSILVWIIGIFHTIKITNPVEERQRFKVRIPLIVIGPVLCAFGIAGLIVTLAIVQESLKESDYTEKNLGTTFLGALVYQPDTLKILSNITNTNSTYLQEKIRVEIESRTNLVHTDKFGYLIMFSLIGIIGFIMTVLGVTSPHMLSKTAM